MLSFLGCIMGLWLLSWACNDDTIEFGKDKVEPLRGMLAILIIIHHLSYHVGGLSQLHSWGEPVVSMFLFISGYGLMVSYRNKGKAYLNGFFKHRLISSILVSFVLASILYRIVTRNYTGIGESMADLVLKGHTVLPYSWYVFAILLFYTLFYIGCRIRGGEWLIAIVVIGMAIYVAAVTSLGYGRHWYISVGGFVSGLLCAKYDYKILRPHRFGNLFVPIGVFIVGMLYLTHIEPAYMLVYAIIPLVLFWLCATLDVAKLSGIPGFKWLGSHSYEIYLCQGIGIYMADCVIGIGQTGVGPVLLYTMMTFFVTGICAWIVKMLKTKIIALFGN